MHEHSYISSVTKQPTCTETGVKTYTCICNDTYTEDIPALGHDYKLINTVDSDCTTAGNKHYECKNCNAVKDEAIPATGHSYSEWKTIKEPTYTTDGSKSRTCSKCNNVETAVTNLTIIETNGSSIYRKTELINLSHYQKICLNASGANYNSMGAKDCSAGILVYDSNNNLLKSYYNANGSWSLSPMYLDISELSDRVILLLHVVGNTVFIIP